jgi:osmotically-inducible protein OsmY
MPTPSGPPTAPSPTVRTQSGDRKPAAPLQSGSPVFCANDPIAVGKLHSGSRQGATPEPLLVSAGWWRRVVRRVPSDVVLSYDGGRIQLGIPRAEFVGLAHYLPDREVVASVRDSFRDFKPFRYSGAASMTVASHGGTVTLSGNVAHEGHRREAVRCAEKANGVVAVSDRLISDEQLMSAVARSFLPHPDLQPSLVGVSARLGTVVLDGELASEELISRALAVASRVDGVIALVNRLKLPAPRTASPDRRLS